MTIDLSVFEQKMACFQLPEKAALAVAVSGGADSLCLTFLLKHFAQKHQCSLTALTVDHNIRPESGQEAEFVHDLLTQHQITHITLVNQEMLSQTRLEEKARFIRYELLCKYCQEHNISYLFLAHHQSDQIETFLARLARGSGIDGLSAIKPNTKRKGIHLLRPLLTTSKTELTDFLKHQGISWIEDPMNQDTSFERVKWRQFLGTLNNNGLTQKAMSLSVQRLNRAREALTFYKDSFIRKHLYFSSLGYIKIDNEPFFALPEEIKIRVLSYAIQEVGQSEKPLSLESLESLVKRLPARATLGECIIISHKKGLFIGKESDRQEKEKFIPPNTRTKWDRFLILSPISIWIKAKAPQIRLPDIPFAIQKSFPSIWIQKELEKKMNIDYKKWNDYHISIQLESTTKD